MNTLESVAIELLENSLAYEQFLAFRDYLKKIKEDRLYDESIPDELEDKLWNLPVHSEFAHQTFMCIQFRAARKLLNSIMYSRWALKEYKDSSIKVHCQYMAEQESLQKCIVRYSQECIRSFEVMCFEYKASVNDYGEFCGVSPDDVSVW